VVADVAAVTAVAVVAAAAVVTVVIAAAAVATAAAVVAAAIASHAGKHLPIATLSSLLRVLLRLRGEVFSKTHHEDTEFAEVAGE
jgi:hypothetical protein